MQRGIFYNHFKIDLIVIHCSATRSDRRFSVEDLIACHNARHYNQHSIGICYEGGLTPEGAYADTRTAAQKHALHALLRSLKVDYPDAHILGHRDLPGVAKACPCFDAAEEYRDLKA